MRYLYEDLIKKDADFIKDMLYIKNFEELKVKACKLLSKLNARLKNFK